MPYKKTGCSPAKIKKTCANLGLKISPEIARCIATQTQVLEDMGAPMSTAQIVKCAQLKKREAIESYTRTLKWGAIDDYYDDLSL